MNGEPHRIVFNGAYQEVWPHYVRTTLAGGRHVHAAPEGTFEYRFQAHQRGYPASPEGAARANREHDLLHLLVAQSLSRDWRADSAILNAVADGTFDELPQWLWRGEERLVGDLALYINTGQAMPSLAALVLAGWDLDEMKARVLHLRAILEAGETDAADAGAEL